MLFDLKGKSVAEHWDIVADLLNCNISMFRNQKSLAVSWLTHFYAWIYTCQRECLHRAAYAI